MCGTCLATGADATGTAETWTETIEHPERNDDKFTTTNNAAE
jgi:hypothetical protein